MGFWKNTKLSNVYREVNQKQCFFMKLLTEKKENVDHDP